MTALESLHEAPILEDQKSIELQRKIAHGLGLKFEDLNGVEYNDLRLIEDYVSLDTQVTQEEKG